MNVVYEMLIIATLIVATLIVAQGLESGALSLAPFIQVATHS